MKKLIVFMICLIIIAGIAIGVYSFQLKPVSSESEVVKFNASGATVKIINDLYDAKLIKNKLAAKIYVKLHKDIVPMAGTYELDRSFSTEKIFKIISGGKSIQETIKVRFTEGKRIPDYAKVISEKFGYSEDEVLKVMSDQSYLKELIKKYSFLTDDILNSDIYYPLEGYLFPDTYEFYKDATIKTIVEKLLSRTGNVLDEYSSDIKNSKYSVHEILTIASIIENETKVQEDRPIVSQVIYKRLDMNMSLGMDVTTYYGVRKALTESLTTSDLETKNAYNTRNIEFIGLPVGPISNPRKDAIEAALSPSDTDFIYFYADVYGKGGQAGKLYFAKTFSEFQGLIRKYS